MNLRRQLSAFFIRRYDNLYLITVICIPLPHVATYVDYHQVILQN